MLSDAEYFLNVNPTKFPDTVFMGINERFLGFVLSTRWK